MTFTKKNNRGKKSKGKGQVAPPIFISEKQRAPKEKDKWNPIKRKV